ncbi:MAG: phenylphosphate carboxylase subunit beta [Syntrophorhabdaceae bacterium]|nr:phenylphosphate carboxylase subunit beta [Syntrophorhabdaceae bacterium]
MKELREFIAKCEKEGELKRIKTKVDWNLEVSHIAKLNEEKKGPALLFENVKDYKIPLLTSAFTTPKRLAIALGMPLNYSMCQMAKEWMKITTKQLTKPKVVKSGPVQEMIVKEKDIDLLRDFPVPYMYPQDGGRFVGTAEYLITKDMETGWTNLGTYRMQVHDRNHAGIQIIKGKHADFHFNQYKKAKKLMPAAAVIGCDPLHFLVSSTLVGAQVDEYDIIGALRGAPVEVIKSDLTGLMLPAHAEIILEGFIDPEDLREEGPFGEYTGYYSGKKGEEWPKQVLHIKRILRRKNPIFWSTTVGKPVTDTHMIQSLNRTATMWTDLENMRVPGIQSVYLPPQSGGRFWAIVSVKTMYPGHSNHVGTAVISTTTGHYGLKGVIVVDADIPADDIDKVLWSLSMRYDPYRSTEIIKRGRSTPLDPALPIEARDIVSRIIMDATVPYEWARKPNEVFLDEEMVKKVQARWKEYGL